MRRFQLIAQNVDVLPLLLELRRADHLWDATTMRRDYPDTPHAAMRDIIARYMPLEQATLETRRREHRNVFWPAWPELPSLRPLVFSLMARVAAVELGSILITKLPPGGEILPHSDAGSWAPEYYNTKVHVTLAGSSRTRCDGEDCIQRAGEAWTFDNLLLHSIENNGDGDRVCVIVSMRCE